VLRHPSPPSQGKKKGVLGPSPCPRPRPSLAPPEEDGAPRDRAASAKAAADGASALARGDLVRAQIAFDRAVRADASNPDAVAGLAEVAFENARYTEALDYGRRAVRLQPRAAKNHVVVGDAYFKLLRYDEAQAAYKRAQAIAPNDEGIKARHRPREGPPGRVAQSHGEAFGTRDRPTPSPPLGLRPRPRRRASLGAYHLGFGEAARSAGVGRAGWQVPSAEQNPSRVPISIKTIRIRPRWRPWRCFPAAALDKGRPRQR
jgi:tetratricopeptide (TPR) repeat protein